jgi:hypothetical protein
MDFLLLTEVTRFLNLGLERLPSASTYAHSLFRCSNPTLSLAAIHPRPSPIVTMVMKAVDGANDG